MKKLFFILILAAAIAKFPVKAAPYPGCDCASVVACETAACFAEFGVGCISQSGRIDALCMCKDNAMAHCTNWDSDLVHCTKDTEVMYCPPRAEMQKRLGEKYDDIIKATEDALKKQQLKGTKNPIEDQESKEEANNPVENQEPKEDTTKPLTK